MSLPPTIPAGRDPFSIEPKRLHDHWKSIVVFGAIASTLSVLAPYKNGRALLRWNAEA